jgi:hypothetical protein
MKKSELKMIIKEVLEESRLYQEDTEEAGEVESPEEEADEEGLKEQIKEYFLNAEDLNDEAYHTFLTDELGIEPDVGEGLAYEILKELLVKESEEGDEEVEEGCSKMAEEEYEDEDEEEAEEGYQGDRLSRGGKVNYGKEIVEENEFDPEQFPWTIVDENGVPQESFESEEYAIDALQGWVEDGEDVEGYSVVETSSIY